MRVCVLHVNSSTLNSTSPTMRIAKFAASQIPGAAFVYNVETADQHKDTVFDVLFVKYGMLKFSNHRDAALKIHENAKVVINMENDYTFKPDKRFRKADETWSTVDQRTRYVNWNVLTRHGTEGWEDKPAEPEVRVPGLLYYGAFRPDRIEYFKRYLQHPPYAATVSSFMGRKKFAELCGPKLKLMPAFRKPDEPAKWDMTVYIEDKTSHSLYCSPANRFYEALHMGLAQAIDVNAVETLKTAGLRKIEQFVVSNKKDLKVLLGKAEDVRKQQQKLWRRDYSLDLVDQFASAMKEISK